MLPTHPDTPFVRPFSLHCPYIIPYRKSRSFSKQKTRSRAINGINCRTGKECCLRTCQATERSSMMGIGILDANMGRERAFGSATRRAPLVNMTAAGKKILLTAAGNGLRVSSPMKETGERGCSTARAPCSAGSSPTLGGGRRASSTESGAPNTLTALSLRRAQSFCSISLYFFAGRVV